jgi:hypothetical protein
MSREPDRIGSQKSSRPSATFSGVVGLSGGDGTARGNALNTEDGRADGAGAGCAPIVQATTAAAATRARTLFPPWLERPAQLVGERSQAAGAGWRLRTRVFPVQRARP